MTPFFSVVIPVYNRATLLRTALQSVLAQTDQDFEVIVVDDGSSDDPVRTVKDLADSRVTILKQENRGGASARNAGVDIARGQFVAFLDSDDRFLPGHLARMRLMLGDTKNTAAYAPVIVERGGSTSFIKPPRAIDPGEHMATYVLCDRGFVPTITLVVHRELARSVRYDERLGFAQDTDFCIRLYLAGCRFVMAREPGAVWNDMVDTHRVSAGRKGACMVEWLARIRPNIPLKAFYGAQGWMIAKGVASSDVSAALWLYSSALVRGCYRPRVAVVVLLQILVPDMAYRRLANLVIRAFRGAVWSRSDRLARRTAY
jgi:glycosyltransferase involved in cell wall biosynthesis